MVTEELLNEKLNAKIKPLYLMILDLHEQLMALALASKIDPQRSEKAREQAREHWDKARREIEREFGQEAFLALLRKYRGPLQ